MRASSAAASRGASAATVPVNYAPQLESATSVTWSCWSTATSSCKQKACKKRNRNSHSSRNEVLRKKNLTCSRAEKKKQEPSSHPQPHSHRPLPPFSHSQKTHCERPLGASTPLGVASVAADIKGCAVDVDVVVVTDSAVSGGASSFFCFFLKHNNNKILHKIPRSCVDLGGHMGAAL